ncbi:uncharacterized protein G2W53_009412 [Senna tora]|uniref:Uncharacterized protein n=1 Tax=Senna tora TaxID=362788 RepID=A0A834WYX5_9FABA|nr:uncharacterized protein G2W53_009412 [Senna tora]
MSLIAVKAQSEKATQAYINSEMTGGTMPLGLHSNLRQPRPALASI